MSPADELPSNVSIEEYLARIPTDVEWARREAERFRHLSTDERFDVLESLLRLMQELLDGRRPSRESSRDFWRHWSDPHFGRPR